MFRRVFYDRWTVEVTKNEELENIWKLAILN
jgi:hypothetical protein